jgi:hypothetical protein
MRIILDEARPGKGLPSRKSQRNRLVRLFTKGKTEHRIGVRGHSETAID